MFLAPVIFARLWDLYSRKSLLHKTSLLLGIYSIVIDIAMIKITYTIVCGISFLFYLREKSCEGRLIS